MRFTIEYPLERHGYAPEFRRPDNLIRVVQAAEQAGFGAIFFSEHPAPSRKWLDAGGHHTFDSIAALSFCAAVTTRIRLMTNLLVLPYRNPWLNAKSLATVDQLSGGRLTAVAGTGYLKSEFQALGVDFGERNALSDEAVELITQAWNGEPVTFHGRHFSSSNQQLQPPPVQPRLPLWIGGNSKLSRRRVARYGFGWSPVFGRGGLASGALRTAALETVEDLAAAVDELHQDLRSHNRDIDTVDVQVEAPGAAVPGGDPEIGRHIDQLGELAKAGATWAIVHLPGESVESALDAIGHYGQQVVSVLDGTAD
jgi:probable F420-dependent oxidoreductase